MDKCRLMIVGGQVFPGSRGQKTRSGKTTGRPVVRRRMPLRDTWESTRLAHVENHPIERQQPKD